MDWLYYSILLIVLVGGLLLNVLTLPGNWLMVLGDVLFIWITGHRYTSWWWILAFTLVAGVAEIVELAAAGRGVKKLGGTLWGTIGALAGAVVGGIFLTPLIPVPIVGTLVGILVGTFLGAMALEWVAGHQVVKSAAIGYGAAKGRLYGTLLKIAFGGVVLLLSLIVCFPVGGGAKAATVLVPAPAPIARPLPTTVPSALPASTLPATNPVGG